jgi:hypothetical protein
MTWPKPHRVLILIATSFIVFTAFSSCATKPADPLAAQILPSPSPPKPPPEPPKEAEVIWRCKISNGEGRIFTGATDTRFSSENKARHECELFSRHCFLLGCQSETTQ